VRVSFRFREPKRLGRIGNGGGDDDDDGGGGDYDDDDDYNCQQCTSLFTSIYSARQHAARHRDRTRINKLKMRDVSENIISSAP